MIKILFHETKNKSAVWRSTHFSASQILREINLAHSKGPKMAYLTVSQVLNSFRQNQNTEPLKLSNLPFLDL